MTITENVEWKDAAPVGGNGKNGTVRVAAKLREIAKDMGMEESPSSPGLYYREAKDGNGEPTGIVSWDFRPDKDNKPHPEGVVSIMDGVSSFSEHNDRKRLEKNPLCATIMRRRDEYITKIQKKARAAAGIDDEIEDLVVTEVKVEGKKMIDQVNAEAHEKYEKRTAEDYVSAAAAGAVNLPATTVSAPDSITTMSPSKSVPAVRDGQNGMVVDVNKGKPTAMIVNGIEIPNDYVYWYGTKKNGKIVGVKPYIGVMGVEYLANKMEILYVDPRFSDPNVPAKDLTPAVDVVIVKSPYVENELGPKGYAILRGIVRTKNGVVFTKLGTATPENTNSQQRKFILEQAQARARGGALREATQCNVCTIEEANLEISGDKVLVKGLPNEKGEVIDAQYEIISQSVGVQQ